MDHKNKKTNNSSSIYSCKTNEKIWVD